MNKQEFLNQLKIKLRRLPEKETEERLTFYSEMIDDRMEEGLSEEQAVAAIGNVNEIATQIIADIPFTSIVKEKMKSNKRLKTWEIVLLAISSPIWLSLLIAAFAVVLSVYVVLWSAIVSLWAIFAALIGCAVGGILAGFIFLFSGSVAAGFATIGAAIFSGGAAILFFYGCKVTTKAIVFLTKQIALGIKKLFIGKEN